MSMTNGGVVISVQGLTKSFGDKVVVRSLDMEVRQGEIFGFLGPNGSGKTTFLRMLCGLLKPDAGQGVCLGRDILREAEEIKPLVGYLSQKFSLYDDLTVRENLTFTARAYAVPNRGRAVERCIERMNLAASRSSWRGASPGAGNSGWPWPPASCTNPGCSCWTSPRPGWTPARGGTSGTRCGAWRPRA